MISFFSTPYNSPILISLAVAYGIVASITIFDFRLIQARKTGALLEDEPLLPNWVAHLNWVELLIFAGMVLLNWKFALIVFGITFLLKVLPVLEIIGNFLTVPFRNTGNKI
jgi:energy-coupling factor transporter transmembrane protein EcfT